MSETTRRYTVEPAAEGTGERYDTDAADYALRMLCSVADRDGKAHLIDRLPSGYVKGFVLHRNT